VTGRIGTWGLAIALVVSSAGHGATTFRAFGDSLTVGIGDESGQGGYPPRLQKTLRKTDFPAAEVSNHGVGGEPTSTGVSRIDGVVSLGGDFMLIMEGTNDVRVGLSLETTLFNLSEMARKSQDGGLTPVYATIIPRIPTANKDPENILTWKIVVGQRDLAWEESRDLVDNYEIFDNTPNKFDSIYSTDPEDTTGHPNAAGYDIMADTFADYLRGRDRIGPVPGDFQPADDAAAPSRVRLEVVLYDFGRGIDLDNSFLVIDGDEVSPEISGDQRKATLSILVDGEYSGQTTLGVNAPDLRSPKPNRINRTLSTFTIDGGDGGTPPPGGGTGDGDIDGSGRVDGIDLVLLGLHFGATAGESRFEPSCDLNGDGIIDGDDLAILASNFGRTTG